MTGNLAGLDLSRAELINFANKMQIKAQAEHQEARHWMNRALKAEARLVILEQEKHR